MSRPRSDIEPRILTAARERFLTDGVDGASLREIARDAGTNIGMVVYYFRTKDQLFLAVIEEVYATIVSDLERVFRTDGPALDRLRHGFVRLGTASDIEFEVLRLILREALGSTRRLRQIVRRFKRGHVPLILQTLKDGVRRGEFDRRIPLPLLLLIVFGVGALPQLLRRTSALTPLLKTLPDAETLATLSIQVLSRAVGTTGDARHLG